MVKYTFVIGAGASAPFGCPPGKRLWNYILQFLRKNESDDPNNPESFVSWIGLPVTQNRLSGLRHAMESADRDSIDALLASHKGDRCIGLLCIAWILKKYERAAIQSLSHNPDWLGYLFEKLTGTPTWMETSEITFITFNYDRIIEHHFQNRFQHAFALPTEDATRMRKLIRALHVHGSLGDYDPDVGLSDDYHHPSALRDVARSIRIVHDSASDQALLEECREAICTADVVAFLGFGFDKVNLLRVMPKEMRWPKRFYGGSRFSMMDGELPSLDGGLVSTECEQRNALVSDAGPQKFQWAREADDCLMTLRSLRILQ